MVLPNKNSVPIVYPETNFQPIAETDFHIDEMMNLWFTLKDFFRNDSDIYIATNLFIYYEEGNPNTSVSPDVFIVKGVEKKLRRIYKQWEEQQPPSFALELTSQSSKLQDLGTKRALYAMLGVRYYFIYAPLEEYLTPPLQGYVLTGNEYELLTPSETNAFTVPELGFELMVESYHLRLIDLKTGQKLLTPAEKDEELRNTQQRISNLENELETLKSKLEKLENK